MSEPDNQKSGGRYRNYLLSLILEFMEQQVADPDSEMRLADVAPPVGATSTEAELDDLARELHMSLCRACGMTADQIIVEWNRRSPEDLW